MGNSVISERVNRKKLEETAKRFGEIKQDNASWYEKNIVQPVTTWLNTRPGGPVVGIVKAASSFLPLVGEALDVAEGHPGMAALGTIPVVGDAIQAGGKIVREASSVADGLEFAKALRQKWGRVTPDDMTIGSLHLEGIDDIPIAQTIDAHGLSKLAQEENLINLIENGVDPNRRWFSASLARNKSLKGVPLGTASGTAYRDGRYIVAAAPGKTLKDDGVKYILVNDLDNAGGVPVAVQEMLRKRYADKGIEVIRYSAAPNFFKNLKYQSGGQIKPNFIKRLEDPNRKSILDWANKPTWRNNYTYDISTHKMGYEYAPDDTGRAIVFPEVQEVNGKLVDFTRPPYHSWAGYDSALDGGDHLMMKDLEEARKWVEGYKDRYKNLK